jgi:hypothetical protein
VNRDDGPALAAVIMYVQRPGGKHLE